LGAFINRLSIRKFLYFILLAALLPGCKGKYDELDISPYHYRETKNLVRFVYDASRKLQSGGMKSLEYFAANRDKYNKGNQYLYVYNMQGDNLFHAGMPNLEGKNLWAIRDKDNKPIFQMVVKALADETNPHAWVHYSWWKPGNFYPVPKSSCHFKVTTPEGRELLVGGGLNYPLEEKEFIRIIVDNAVELLAEKGEDALAEISDPLSEYNFRDTCVFVFHENGRILVSPVINDSRYQINLLECEDAVGHKPFAKAIQALVSNNQTWEIFMAKNKYQRSFVKKSLYLHKAILNGDIIYVGAVTDLPQMP